MSDPQTSANSRTVNISINVDNLIATLNRQLQVVIDNVAAGLYYVDTCDWAKMTKGSALDDVHWEPKLLPMPGATFPFYSAPQVPDSEVLKKRYRTWVLTSGFRDAIELASGFLDRIRPICALLKLAGVRVPKPTNLQNVMSADESKFKKYGLPRRIEYFKEKCGLKCNPDHTQAILSINGARNCLVHRYGLVTEKDADRGGKLRIAWRRPRLFAKDKDGKERDMIPPCRLEPGEPLLMSFSTMSRSFNVGETISFTPQEFCEICFTISAWVSSWGQCIRDAVQEGARRHSANASTDRT